MNRLNPHQRPHDPGLPHGFQKFGFFGRFHRDLGKEDHLFRKFGQALHQFESLRADGFQRRQLRLVLLPLGEFNVVQRHGVEVVVRKRNEAKSQPVSQSPSRTRFGVRP